MEPQRNTRNTLVSALTIALGLLFIVTGAMKLIGSTRDIFPGSAMGQHPGWFRLVVGVAELACGALLLLPSTAGAAAFGIALIMGAAAVTLFITGQPGLIYPIVIGAVALAAAWLRRPPEVQGWIDGELSHPHRIAREGLIAGVLGATAIAIWFLVVDLVAGRPFFTPIELGRAMLSVLGTTPVQDSNTVYVLVYTLFHFFAFIAVGIIAVAVIEFAKSEPSVLAGAVILFIVFELAFNGFVALLRETTNLGWLSWTQVMAGNLIAAIVMGTYLWRAHPELRESLTHALDGTA